MQARCCTRPSIAVAGEDARSVVQPGRGGRPAGDRNAPVWRRQVVHSTRPGRSRAPVEAPAPVARADRCRLLGQHASYSLSAMFALPTLPRRRLLLIWRFCDRRREGERGLSPSLVPDHSGTQLLLLGNRALRVGIHGFRELGVHSLGTYLWRVRSKCYAFSLFCGFRWRTS